MTRNERVARQLLHGRINRRIERVFNLHCFGSVVDADGHAKVFDEGRRAIAENPKISDLDLAKIIVAFVLTIRKNQ
jgi:hypothetical protein